MSLDDSLDHFMFCFSREEQLHYWRYMQEDRDEAGRCRMRDHDRTIREHQEYIMILRNQLDGKN